MANIGQADCRSKVKDVETKPVKSTLLPQSECIKENIRNSSTSSRWRINIFFRHAVMSHKCLLASPLDAVL